MMMVQRSRTYSRAKTLVNALVIAERSHNVKECSKNNA